MSITRACGDDRASTRLCPCPTAAARAPGAQGSATDPAQGQRHDLSTRRPHPGAQHPSPPWLPGLQVNLFSIPLRPLRSRSLTPTMCNRDLNQIRQSSSPRARGLAARRGGGLHAAGAAGRVRGGPARVALASGARGGRAAPRGAGAAAAILRAGAPRRSGRRAGRRGARPRDPAPPGTLGSAGRGRTAPAQPQRERSGPLQAPRVSGAGGARAAGFAGFAVRAARRGRGPGLDGRCGGAGPAALEPRTAGPRGEPGSPGGRPGAGSRGPGVPERAAGGGPARHPRTGLLCGPSKRQVKLSLPRGRAGCPATSPSRGSPSRSAGGAGLRGRAPAAWLGRAGTLFKKCFSKA